MSVICEKTLTNLVQCLSVVHIIGCLVSGNQDQNLVRQIFEIGYNRLSSPNKLAWRNIAKSSNRKALQVSGMFSVKRVPSGYV
jgi:hypothetical protein